jgi:hypothetical protein
MTQEQIIAKLEVLIAEIKQSEAPVSPPIFVAAKEEIPNRGSAPDAFLAELTSWAKTAHPAIFAYNDQQDIYASLNAELGPYETELERRAVMCEALRVLGGFESSWDWTEGRDSTNPNEDSAANEEAGIFQTSYDSIGFDPSLKVCMEKYNVHNAVQFIERSKSNHTFAFEYTARVLRWSTNHHGPIKRQEIDAWVSREAVKEFETALKA